MNESSDDELDDLIRTIPEGWSRADIDGQSWAVIRTTRAGGKAVSVEAELLGTNERIGANVRITSGGATLRPCEVSEEKVMQFLRAAAKELSA